MDTVYTEWSIRSTPRNRMSLGDEISLFDRKNANYENCFSFLPQNTWGATTTTTASKTKRTFSHKSVNCPRKNRAFYWPMFAIFYPEKRCLWIPPVLSRRNDRGNYPPQVKTSYKSQEAEKSGKEEFFVVKHWNEFRRIFTSPKKYLHGRRKLISAKNPKWRKK